MEISHKKPLEVFEELIDQFYEKEHELELLFGYTPIDVRQCPYTTFLPYFEEQECEEVYEKFQKIYNDLSNLMHEVKDIQNG